MTAGAFLLLSLTAVIAVADWIAVASDRRAVEFVCKPLVMVGLIAVAVAADPSSDAARFLLILGLLASMTGDVVLMLPSDRFVPGLASFLVAHLLYICALLALGVDLRGVASGAFVMAIVLLVIGRRVVDGARSHDRAVAAPVTAYMVVLAAMVAIAVGTGRPIAVLGAAAFAFSDTILGWTRFVHDLPNGRVIVMVTYHLGQAGLVLALI